MSETTSTAALGGKFEPQSALSALQLKAWVAGGVGAAVLALGFVTAEKVDFLRAYLVGWMWLVCLALGLFAIGMLGHITGGEWAAMLRRLSEASGRTLPIVLLFGLPIVLDLEVLYPWAVPGVTEHDPILAHKEPWLNTGGFVLRAVIYFALWSGLAFVLSSMSRRWEETGDQEIKERMKRISGVGIVFYVLASTFASVDWVMSLDPHWFSSLFGFVFVGGQGLAAFAFSVLALNFLRQGEPYAKTIRLKLFHDVGKLMLAFTMLWGYFMISQYLIIWSGNLPEEIGWYIQRDTHGWKAISVFLVIGHFALPFLLLLSADLKKKPKLLGWVAVWVLAMRWLDYYWQVAPSVHHHAETTSVIPTWIDLAAPVGLGGLWLALLIGQFKGRTALPAREPILQEVHGHG